MGVFDFFFAWPRIVEMNYKKERFRRVFARRLVKKLNATLTCYGRLGRPIGRVVRVVVPALRLFMIASLAFLFVSPSFFVLAPQFLPPEFVGAHVVDSLTVSLAPVRANGDRSAGIDRIVPGVVRRRPRGAERKRGGP